MIFFGKSPLFLQEWTDLYIFAENLRIMLYRQFEKRIEKFFREEPNKILLVNGARQIGKSYLIRYVGKKLFKNYVEINLKEDRESRGIFATAMNTEDFYMQLGTIAGNRLGSKKDTLVFLDERVRRLYGK